MKKNLILLCSLFCLSVLASCTKDKDLTDGALKDKTKRTILAYVFQDTNLFADLTNNINEMEQGWDPQINGTLLVYLDASTRMTQFEGKPVLIEIQHDKSNLIVSKIVKVYPDADAARSDVFKQVQEDAIAMYPAESYGLILSGHGNGFFVSPPDTKGINGSDRWGSKKLDVDVIANNTAVHYDFIVFDACNMGETSTLFQLRNATDFVVASVESSPGEGFAYRSDLKALFTQPKADLYTFVNESRNYFNNTTLLAEYKYTTIGVYRMSAMDNLAAITQKAVEKLNLKYRDLEQKAIATINNPNNKFKSSMYYPHDFPLGVSTWYYDMGLLLILLEDNGHKDLAKELKTACRAVVMQRMFSFSEEFLKNNANYERYSANLSFYIPNSKGNPTYQTEEFYKRFEWSTASGFTNKWE